VQPPASGAGASLASLLFAEGGVSGGAAAAPAAPAGPATAGGGSGGSRQAGALAPTQERGAQHAPPRNSLAAKLARFGMPQP
jgi:hypothetical protein